MSLYKADSRLKKVLTDSPPNQTVRAVLTLTDAGDSTRPDSGLGPIISAFRTRTDYRAALD